MNPIVSLLASIFSIILGVVTLLGVIIAMTKWLVSNSTRVEHAITSLTQSVNNLSEAIKLGLNEVHDRVDKSDSEMKTLSNKLNLLNTNMSLVAQKLGIQLEHEG